MWAVKKHTMKTRLYGFHRELTAFHQKHLIAHRKIPHIRQTHDICFEYFKALVNSFNR